MFKEWDFLLAEIWVLIALAALIGLIAGWIIWGGRPDIGADADEVRRLQAELDREQARSRAQSGDPVDDVPAMEGGGYTRPTPMTPLAATPIEPFKPHTPSADDTKPAGLNAARNGIADDLTKISGVGHKMEKLCNDLGFWHYDQIASWSGDEIAWVDENLEGFKGRVTRDKWVEQAKVLAKNQPSAVVRRKD